MAIFLLTSDDRHPLHPSILEQYLAHLTLSFLHYLHHLDALPFALLTSISSAIESALRHIGHGKSNVVSPTWITTVLRSHVFQWHPPAQSCYTADHFLNAWKSRALPHNSRFLSIDLLTLFRLTIVLSFGNDNSIVSGSSVSESYSTLFAEMRVPPEEV